MSTVRIQLTIFVKTQRNAQSYHRACANDEMISYMTRKRWYRGEDIELSRSQGEQLLGKKDIRWEGEAIKAVEVTVDHISLRQEWERAIRSINSTRRRISWIFFKRRSLMFGPSPAGMPGRRRQIGPIHHSYHWIPRGIGWWCIYEGSLWLPRQSHAHSIRFLHSSSREVLDALLPYLTHMCNVSRYHYQEDSCRSHSDKPSLLHFWRNHPSIQRSWRTTVQFRIWRWCGRSLRSWFLGNLLDIYSPTIWCLASNQLIVVITQQKPRSSESSRISLVQWIEAAWRYLVFWIWVLP